METAEQTSIYIHIPFCRTRCSYCDFNTYDKVSHLIDPYIAAMLKEIEITCSRLDNVPDVVTLFFGGGTPNVLAAEKIASVIGHVRKVFTVEHQVEISMEVNPTRLSSSYLEAIHLAGINRLSIGMQSAHNDELVLLGRRHRLEDVRQGFLRARKAGFYNINLDLIFGLPNQRLEKFEDSLKEVVHMHPEHISLYALSIEAGTPLKKMVDEGLLPLPEADLAADMYLLAIEKLEEEGYEQYEISNWAIDKEHQCRHNLQYWQNGNYLGFGAGAHSHYKQYRWENIEKIPEYIDGVEKPETEGSFHSPAAKHQTTLGRNDDLGETMMMGLRLTKSGVSSCEFKERFGLDLTGTYQGEIHQLIGKGLLEWAEGEDGQLLRLTPRGRLLGNQVFMEFLRD